MNKRIVIWGASGHARVVADIFRLNGWAIAGFLDDVNPRQHATKFCGSQILGGKEKLESLKRGGVDRISIAIGIGRARMESALLAEELGFVLTSAIHPKAIIASDAEIGAGTVLAAGAIVNANTELGRNVIINTGATVDHDCIIDDGAHICPGTHVAANVKIGKLSWIGIGSAVIERINIGANVMIGAGAVVVADIPDGVVAYGNPARIRRPIKESDYCS